MVHAHLDRNSSSEVTAAAVIADNSVVRGDGGGRGIQGSGVILDDTDSLIIPTSLTLGESEKDVTFTVNGVSIEAVAALHTSGLTDLGGFVEERHSNTSTLGAHNLMLRSRGTEDASTVVQNADFIGRIVSCGYDGTDFAQSAEIRTSIDGTPGDNDMPGKIELFTSADGSQSPTLGFTLDSSQEVTLANALAETSGGTGTATYTTGDLLYASASNTLSKLAVGSNADVLTLAAGVPSWATPAASGLVPELVAKDYLWGWADFISANNNPNEFGRYSSGGSGGFLNGEAGHPGIYQLTTSTSATGFSKMYNGQKGFIVGSGEITVEWCIDLRTALSDGTETYTAFVGLFEEGITTKLSAAGDLIGFRYTHTENSGNWTAVCKEDGSESTGDLGTAVVADTWVRLKVIINAGATSAAFYINDVEGSNSPITTNIPDSADQLTFASAIEKSNGTTSRSLYLDYCEWIQAFSSSRND